MLEMSVDHETAPTKEGQGSGTQRVPSSCPKDAHLEKTQENNLCQIPHYTQDGTNQNYQNLPSSQDGTHQHHQNHPNLQDGTNQHQQSQPNAQDEGCDVPVRPPGGAPEGLLEVPSAQQPRVNKRRSTLNPTFKMPMSGKRRRRANSESNSVLPSNFQLGGNIFDPLNLNSLLDEEVNRALNAETPKSSPLPPKSREPVEILIPRDITDPLNLNSGVTGDTSPLVSPIKTSGGRRRHRNRHHGGPGGGVPGGPHAPNLAHLEGEAPPLASSPLLLTGSLVAEDNVPPEAASLLNATATWPATSYSGFSPSTSSAPLTVSISAASEESQNPPDPANKPKAAQKTAGHAGMVPVVLHDNAFSVVTPRSLQHPPARHRKRRRASSRSENSGALSSSSSSSSGPPLKNARLEKGPRPPPTMTIRLNQTFQTPANSSGQSQQNGSFGTGRRGNGPQQFRSKKKFQYGNYTKYYGYRNPRASSDPRMELMEPEWFQGRSVLDLGCNTGLLTLAIAKQWRPSRIVGLDIDGSLIHAARQNLRYYLSDIQAYQAHTHKCAKDVQPTCAHVHTQDGQHESHGTGHDNRSREEVSDSEPKHVQRKKVEQEAEEENRASSGNKPTGDTSGAGLEQKPIEDTERSSSGEQTDSKKDGKVTNSRNGQDDSPPYMTGSTFPVSLRISRGPIAAPPLPSPSNQSPGSFPGNISFVKANYVLESDQLLLTQRAEYDIILCLSVTKWVHLNWGDAGLKRLFHRIYRHLCPGGLLVLEPQPWSSYGRRKRLTESIYKNYSSIRLKPDQFTCYLMSQVGFSSYELIGTSKNASPGFQRPIYLFHKAAPSK